MLPKVFELLKFYCIYFFFQFGFGGGKKDGGKEKQKSKSTSLPPGRGPPSSNGGGDDSTADFINNLQTFEVEERFEQMLVSGYRIYPGIIRGVCPSRMTSYN